MAADGHLRCYNGAVVVGIACDTDLGPGYESNLDGLHHRAGQWRRVPSRVTDRLITNGHGIRELAGHGGQER
jgi:hypothetical protein